MDSPGAAQQMKTLLTDVNGVVRVSINHDTETVDIIVTDTVRTEQLKAAIDGFRE